MFWLYFSPISKIHAVIQGKVLSPQRVGSCSNSKQTYSSIKCHHIAILLRVTGIYFLLLVGLKISARHYRVHNVLSKLKIFSGTELTFQKTALSSLKCWTIAIFHLKGYLNFFHLFVEKGKDYFVKVSSYNSSMSKTKEEYHSLL